jgi:hypothetical protein
LFAQRWNIAQENPQSAVFDCVKRMQLALRGCQALPVEYQPNGILDPQTVAAVKSIVSFRDNRFFIDPKIWARLCRTNHVQQ